MGTEHQTQVKNMKRSKMRKIFLTGIAGLLVAGSAFAHHAMEYIEMESYTTAAKGESVLHIHYDYMVDDKDNSDLDHWEFTPGLSYGITDRLMVDVHTHFAKFGIGHVVDEQVEAYEPDGPSPFMEAIAAALQYRLTEGSIVDIGIAGTVEFPFSRAEDLLGSEDNVYAATLIVSKDFRQHGNVCLNIIQEFEGSEHETAWALGMKNPISDDPHGIAAGVEVMGDFEGDRWSILPGVYAPLGDEGTILKTGLEFGQEKDDSGTADTMRASVSLMYRF